VKLEEIVATSAAIGRTRSRTAKTELLASCLRRLQPEPEEVPIAVAYLSGRLPRGTIGVGWASLRERPPPAAASTLGLIEVDAALERIRLAVGTGSQAARRRELSALLGAATEPEQEFLSSLLIGELRQGALEGSVVEGVAAAAGVPAAQVRRALMLEGDLGSVAAAAIAEGEAGLRRFGLTVLRPVYPMLAQTAADTADALGRIHPADVEWKLDGVRLQVHVLEGEVRAFARTLADVTDRVPEVVDAMSGLPFEAAILDGEAIALRPDGRPHPFQVTGSRFASRTDVEAQRRSTPLSPFFFDLLHLDGEDLIDRPARERLEIMDRRLPRGLQVPRMVAGDAETAERFLDEALAHGHEGVMVKALDAPYEAGRRGAGWLKVKRAHTLDLVVLAAEWGHGRRHGWLSNLHLGARDPNGGFVMLGKTFKGMTDQVLAWQTERLLELETSREGIVVHVRPELVVEVAFDGLQASPRYPGGMALRFARIKGYRHDKHSGDADAIDTVRAIFAGASSE
jgi:ATP-dependent DNA ligase I